MQHLPHQRTFDPAGSCRTYGDRLRHSICRLQKAVLEFLEFVQPPALAPAYVEVQSIDRLTRTVSMLEAHRQEIERCV